MLTHTVPCTFRFLYLMTFKFKDAGYSQNIRNFSLSLSTSTTSGDGVNCWLQLYQDIWRQALIYVYDEGFAIFHLKEIFINHLIKTHGVNNDTKEQIERKKI